MVLDVAGLDLLTLSGTHELLHGAYHAFQAMKDAYELANRLHCDIHPGNIILYRVPGNEDCTPSTRRGFLIDWDHSCALNDPDKVTPRYEPSLQWQFASMALLQGFPNTPHRLEDDMESMLYVVLYCALLRLRHNFSPEELVQLMNLMFDQSYEFGGTNAGGYHKQINMMSRRMTDPVRWYRSQIQEWIETVYDYLAPTAETPKERHNKWSAAHLDRFWRWFLSKHDSLPRSDVVNYITLHLEAVRTNAPRSVQGTAIQPTTTAGSKRSLVDAINSQAAKRQKLDVTTPSNPLSASAVDRELAQRLAAGARASTPVVNPSGGHPAGTMSSSISANTVQATSSRNTRPKTPTSRKIARKAAGGAGSKNRASRKRAGTSQTKNQSSAGGIELKWHHYQPPAPEP
ncbi:hypothetical protein NUW54_g3931 [Trametes sanguinea]|uniref:Uncharacterized protein n=1 Tax=Trametes sanguinea TaxID=158606 RepID=A0ACC1Q0Z4_9APHY|nr:hypothetical protein NUW54_g3931 [Trametes sanguinea]